MKLISWNVNGIRAAVKKDFAKSMLDLDPDVICLQETKAQPDDIHQVLDSMNGFHIEINSAERKGYSGTAILSKSEPVSVQHGIGIEEHDNEGRVLTCEYDHFYLVTAYVPNSGRGLIRLEYRMDWDEDFLDFLNELQKSKPVILCGDLNVAHQPIDIARPKSNYNKTAGYTQDEIEGFQRILDGGNLVDSFRHLYPDTVAYSWWSYMFQARQKNIGWRLDYFLVSNMLMPKVQDSQILQDILGSDHCPIQLLLKE